MANLPQGLYTIYSQTGLQVSRKHAEDRSMLPKKVLILTPDVRSSPWLISPSSDGKHILKAKGAPVFSKQNALYAALLGDESGSWVLTPQLEQGENAYTIESEDHLTGWVLPNPDEPETQVEVLPVNSSQMANRVFIITRVDQD